MSGPGEPRRWQARVTVVLADVEAAPLAAADGRLRTTEVGVEPGAVVVVELRHPGQVDYRTVPGHRPGAWPVSRRMLVQARDRARPVMDPVIDKVRARHG